MRSNGLYDTQYKDREGPDCRGRLKSAEDGSFSFRAVVPVAYPIPGDVSDRKPLDVFGITHRYCLFRALSDSCWKT